MYAHRGGSKDSFDGDYALNEMKVHRATRQNYFGATVGSIYY
jgi:hypothetical protein